MSLLAKVLGSSLARATMVYGSLNALNRAIPFLLLPVFTRYLTPYDYGMATMFGIALSIASAANGFGVLGTLSLRYFQADKFDMGVYVANCMFILATSTAVFGLGLLAFPGLFQRATELPTSWNWAVLLTSAAGFMSTALLYLLQSSKQALRFGLFKITITLANILLSLWFVIGLKQGWEGRVAAQIIVAVGGGLLSMYYLRQAGWLRWKYDLPSIKAALAMGLPLVPHALAGFVMEATDRVFITNMVGVEQAGIYAVGKQVGMVMLLLASSFNMAWVPWLFEKLGDATPHTKRMLVLLTYGYDLGVLALAFGLGWLAPWLFGILVGRDFVSGADYVLWVALGYAFNAMYMMVTNYVVYAERTSLVSFATGFTAVFHIGISYVLIARNGALGAAQAGALSQLCAFLLTWILSARVFPMPWLPWRIPATTDRPPA